MGGPAPRCQAGFIRKVYAILSIQLVVTVIGAATCMLHEGTRNFVLSTPSMFYAAMFLPIGFIFALMCYKNQHPHSQRRQDSSQRSCGALARSWPARSLPPAAASLPPRACR